MKGAGVRRNEALGDGRARDGGRGDEDDAALTHLTPALEKPLDT